MDNKDKKYEKDAEELVNHALGANVFEREEGAEAARVVRKWEDQPASVKKNIAGSLEDKTKKVKKVEKKREKAEKMEEKRKIKMARKKSAEVGGGGNIKKKGEKNMSMEKTNDGAREPVAGEEKKDRIAEAAGERQRIIDRTFEDENKDEGSPRDEGLSSRGEKEEDFSAEEAQAELYARKKRERGEGGEKVESAEESETEAKVKKESAAEKVEKEKTAAEILEAARGKFVAAEKNYDKYRMLTGKISKVLFSGKREKTAVGEEYKEAKKAYERARAEYVTEGLDKFIDERMKIADERAEKFEKGKWKKTWDWMGKQNLEKLGWKPEGKIGKFLAKGINLRTAVSMGLLGAGVAFGVGSIVGVSALAGKRIFSGVATGMGGYEVLRMATERFPRLTEKKLKGLTLNSAEELMAKYEIRAKLKGEKVSENENYQKLRERYLEILGGAGKNIEMLKNAEAWIGAADKKLEEMSRKLKRGDVYRKIVAAGAGALIGGSGLNKLMEQMNGGPIGAGEVAEAAEVKEMPDKFVGVVQANEGYIHESRKALAMYIHEFGEEKLQNLTPAQKVWAEDRLWDLYREAHPEAEKAILKVGDKVEFSAENIKQALSEVQEKFGAPEKSAQLAETLKDYTDNVAWDRYNMVKHPQMGEVYGWELDEGVKAVDYGREASGTMAAAEKSEIAKELLLDKIEKAKGVLDSVTCEKVYEDFNLSLGDYSVIKDVPVEKFMNEFSYWSAPEDMIYGETDHLELWRKIKLRDWIIKNGVSGGELKMPLHEYLKQHWFEKAMENIVKVEASV